MKRIVVLGTGTNVGKTYFTCNLAKAIAQQTPLATVSAIKPIESGVPIPTPDEVLPRSNPSGPSDAELLGAHSQPAFQPPITDWTFPVPVSPHLAARQAGKAVILGDVVRWIERFERQRVGDSSGTSWSIVETAGAVFSPLAQLATNFDLAIALEPALWILVAPDRLGVLHDVTVTLATMKLRGRLPDLLVLSQSPPADQSTGTNALELMKLGIAEVATVAAFASPLPAPFIESLVTRGDPVHRSPR
jgi:dethiobiotin synthetase